MGPLAAAAAAVVAVVVTLLLTIGHPGSGLTPRTSPTDKAARLVYAFGGRVPPYYIWLGSQGNPNFTPSYAVVRLTATGVVLATITAAAPGDTVVAVTGAADDRTFVLEEQPYDKNNAGVGQYFEPRTFYLLRLRANGRPAGVIRLAITEPSGAGANGLALSPDGTKLAVALQPNNVKSDPGLTELQLFSVSTGALLRTWKADGTIGLSGQDSEALSWAADQKTLAFYWFPTGTGNGNGEYLLDLRKTGTSLVGNSRDAVAQSSQAPLACGGDVIITPDGSAIACGAGDSSTASYEELSTATGQPTRTLAHWSTGSGMTEVLWSNSSGSVLVGEGPSGDVGMITAGTFTAFPGRVIESAGIDQGAW